MPLPSGSLFEVTIHQWSNLAPDQAITAEVRREKGLAPQAGEWKGKKLDPAFFKRITSAAGKVYSALDPFAVPWGRGAWFVPVALRQKAVAALAEAKREFRAAVEKTGEGYAKAIESAKTARNGQFRLADYPGAYDRGDGIIQAHSEGFTGAYSVEDYEFQPPGMVPAALEAIAGDQLAQIQEANARSLEQRTREIEDETARRLLAPLEHAARTLAEPGKIFRDSLVSNIQEAAELAAAMLTDPELAQLAREAAESLGKLDPATLRTDEVERKTVADRAAALAARFGSIAGHRKIVQPTPAPEASPA